VLLLLLLLLLWTKSGRLPAASAAQTSALVTHLSLADPVSTESSLPLLAARHRAEGNKSDDVENGWDVTNVDSGAVDTLDLV
jgi:hypothetical protein